MTTNDTEAPDAYENDKLGRIEDALAAMTPAGEDILAGIGAGAHNLQAPLLATMPTGTAALLRSHGALTVDRTLTDFGVELAEYVAFRRGVAPDPVVRAVVARELAQRTTSAGAPRPVRKRARRRGDDRNDDQAQAAEVEITAQG